ncbi:MAG: glycosyltransferase [Bacteroidales bacterium]|nr:glycosyltransferase [Bacteroidales bacterium]MCM1416084.1 glycosyltransferase [bacterium]MCM1423124.1 glycosyltransferase [bacterium]
MDSVDVIIPVYKPDSGFLMLMERLRAQTVPVNQIILMNTEQKYLDRLLYGTTLERQAHNITVKHLSKREFDHGRTRNQGVRLSEAAVFLMMTQDAVPADEYLVERLLTRLRQEDAAVSYARQLPTKDSGEIERYTRQFNYPPESCVKSSEDLPRLGIKTFFCSNVCAAYDRETFDRLGGFVNHTIFNEDMLYAAKAVEAGCRIAYAADACVYHSHNYTHRQQFHRNFDLGVSQADHPEVFAKYPSESEGIRMVKGLIAHLRQNGMKNKIPHVIIQSAFKYAGYLCGKHYRLLPKRLAVAMSSNKEYWNN